MLIIFNFIQNINLIINQKVKIIQILRSLQFPDDNRMPSMIGYVILRAVIKVIVETSESSIKIKGKCDRSPGPGLASEIYDCFLNKLKVVLLLCLSDNKKIVKNPRHIVFLKLCFRQPCPNWNKCDYHACELWCVRITPRFSSC